MESKVMGVVRCLLVISALLYSVEGQLTGRLVITVEAVSNSAINVYYFIDPQVQGINDVTYTVYYGTDVADPATFDPSTPGAMEMAGPTTPETPATITGIDPATTVTVVVVASSVSAGNNLTSSSQSDITFGGGVSVPTMVGVQRLDGNKAIRVTWMAPTADKIVSYDIQYRTVGQEHVITLSSTDLNDLSIVIDSLSDVTNYEVRVRANIEAPPGDPNTLAITSGPWSAWVESEVNDCTSVCPIRGGAVTLHNGVFLTLFTSLLSIVALCF
ncbi:uncharacterized protein [Dysidea avara]|uniref:uncharacterized protein n=1 Tax=Dysidea avara TaxID=196820 RepID=UPI003330ACA0